MKSSTFSAAALSFVCVAAISSRASDVEILGITVAGDRILVAQSVEVPSGMAMSSIEWYNNDGEILIDEVRVCGVSGDGDETPDYASGSTVAGGFSGGCDQWSELVFDTPVGAFAGALYVVLEVSNPPAYERRGCGGGFGMGYIPRSSSSRNWIGIDGSNWARLSDAWELCLIPRFEPYEDWMDTKSLDDEMDEIVDFGVSVAPNPGNPFFKVSIAVPVSCSAELAVYDIAGRLVKDLYSGAVDAGRSVYRWDGRSADGGRVASGIYILRVNAGGWATVEKLLLAR